jgi:outer membrane biosynthesis protein TonB
MVEDEPPPAPKPEVRPPPPPRPDDIVQPKPTPKKPEPKKPEPKKEEKKKTPPKIEKGKRVERKVESKVKPRTQQTLSDEEVAKLLKKGARIGETTSLPDNEVSRNASLLMRALYDTWTPPTSSGRPTEVTFGIAADGTLLSPRISSSSGSAAYDESCLEAVRRAGRVSGLSAAFIRAYGAGCQFLFTDKN